MSNSEAMDVDMSFLSDGLKLSNESTALSDFDYNELINGLEQSDLFLRSPSGLNGYLYFEGVPQALDMQSDHNNPMLAEGAPMAPQAYAVPGSHAAMDQSERIDSIDDIEPMTLGSIETRAAIEADPTALRESLGSIELNASRKPSAQQSYQAQGRVAAQRQTHALPDSSQTPRPVVTTTTVSPPRTSPDTTTAPSAVHFGNYALPDFHYFKVSVKFMSTLILEKRVTKEGGCLLHYQAPNQAVITVPPELERVSIPIGIKNDQDGTLREFPWVKEKQKRFTELILKSFDRGLELYSKEGTIYAKRKSDTKLFWHNTDKPSGHAHELKRYEETEVFNFDKFRSNLAISYALGKQDDERLPAIWFSFAQKWDWGSSPITTKLVSARVDPIRACEMVKNVNPEVRSTDSLESLHTSLFGFSHETSSGAS